MTKKNFIAYLHQLGQVKKKVMKMKKKWDDHPPCENSQLFFSNEYFPVMLENVCRLDWVSETYKTLKAN